MTSTRVLPLMAVAALLAGCPGSGGNNPTPTPSPPGPPTITSISPASAPVSTVITIVGDSFGDVQGTGTVTFGTTNLLVSSWTNTQIQATVPDLYPATDDVVVHVDTGTDTNAFSFRVILVPAVYVNNDQMDPNSVTGYTVDRATGALTLMANSPYMTGDGGSQFYGDGRLLVLHEGTRRLFATNSMDQGAATRPGSISVFDIDPVTGELTLVPGSPFATGAHHTFGIDVTSDGSRIVAANFEAGSVAQPASLTSFITVMDVANDGTLTQVAGSPFSSALADRTIDIPMITSDDSRVYINSEKSTFLGFELNSDGSLTEINGNPYFTGQNTRAFGARLHPDNGAVYLAEYGLNGMAANGTLGVLVYNLDGDGIATASPNSPIAVEYANGMAFNTDGSKLYVSQFDPNKDGTENQLYLYDVDANGDLTLNANSPFTLNVAGASSIECSSDDRFLFVADEGGATVGVYAMDTAGVPTEVANSPFANAAAPYTTGYGASGMSVTPW